MEKTENRLNRVHHFKNETLIHAWVGVKKRIGKEGIKNFSLDELDENKLFELLKANPVAITGTLADNFRWSKEVIGELKNRLANGTISLLEVTQN